MSKLNINKIGIASRDYRKREKNGHRDFSYAFKGILTTLDEQACDSVLFSLYTIDKRTSFSAKNILENLSLKNIKTIFLEEFEDSKERIHLDYVIYYKEKGQWSEQRLTQKFARGLDLTKKQLVKDFIKEVKDKRIFRNFAILLCGESNIVKSNEDPHNFLPLLDKDINVILNPIHDKMTRYEMKLKRKYLSKQKRWVISIWNKGRSDRNGMVKMDHKNPHGWDIYYDGIARELKPINHSVDNQVDIEIGIINLQ